MDNIGECNERQVPTLNKPDSGFAHILENLEMIDQFSRHEKHMENKRKQGQLSGKGFSYPGVFWIIYSPLAL